MYNIISFLEIDGLIQIGTIKHQQHFLFTPWTIAHFVYGYVFYLLGFNYFSAFIIHSLYEYFNLTNDYFKKTWNQLFYGFKSDSLLNSIGDTIVFMLAMFLAKHYNNNYFFSANFVLGLCFFSPYFQHYLTNYRLQYLQNKFFNLKGIHTTDYTFFHYFTFLIWILINYLVFVKYKT
jgi:hypothetical protein